MSTLNPQQFLHGLVGREVILKLQWGQEFIGYVAAVDANLNIRLIFEAENNHGIRYFGEILVGWHNVLYIAEVDALSQTGETN